MAKLKKSIAQERRRSFRSRSTVAKLTPAEIRTLNHSASVSKSGSVRSIDSQSIRRLPSSTPSLTPGYQSSSQQSHQTHAQRSSSDLSTPVVSPDRERQRSNSSTRHIYSPKPVSHVQAMQLANANSHTRPPSASSYRGIATYRGPEVTRTSSLTMLHTPSQQIVSNPLSQFSRPRQSTLISSSRKVSLEQRGTDDNAVNSVASSQRRQSLGATSRAPSRGHSPIRPSDSPVSMENDKNSKDTELVNAEPSADKGAPVLHVTPQTTKSDENHDEASETSKKQKSIWRKSFGGSTEPDSEIAPLRKEHRRRTLMLPGHGHCLHAVAYADTRPGEPPKLRETLKHELPSAKTAEYKKDDEKQPAEETEYDQHPAVRPLSINARRPSANASETSSSKKGKEREDASNPESEHDATSLSPSMPSYPRCSCCGRVARSGGIGSELSPVLENENPKKNLGSNTERTPPTAGRPSSSVSSQPKFVPNTPTEEGNQKRQSRVETARETAPSVTASEPPARLKGVAVNQLGDVIGPSSMPLAIMPKSKEKSRLVRFASLHMRDEDKEEQNQQESMPDPQPEPQMPRFASLYGLRNIAQQQEQQRQQRNAYPTQQRPASMYQVQKQTQSSPSSNGRHPLRSALSAYDNGTPATPTTNIYTISSSNASQDVLEKPLGDSPSSSRSRRQESPERPISNNGEPIVDLSSFDGSFIHGSLSRSATIMGGTTTPPRTNTSNGLHATNSTRSANEANIGRIMSPAPGPALDRVTWSTSPKGRTNFSRPLTPQSGKINISIPWGHNATTATGASALSSADGTPSRSLSYSIPNTPSAPDAEVGHATSATIHRPGTIVRLVPSYPVMPGTATSSPGHGPMRLGDWVLPEHQKAAAQGAAA